MAALEPPYDRRKRILAALRGRGLHEALYDTNLWRDIEEEAASGDPFALVTPGVLQIARAAEASWQGGAGFGRFLSSDDVLIVPGFLGSELVEVGGAGLLWLDAERVPDGSALARLALGPFRHGRCDSDAPMTDLRGRPGAAQAGPRVVPGGVIPVIYSGLELALKVGRYEVKVFTYDWRKHLHEAARALSDLIRERADRRYRPLHVVAHSMGTLVARRAVQLLGASLARRLVNSLVLLGPMTGGTFRAAMALTRYDDALPTVRRFGVVAEGLQETLRSFSSLYQILPWRTDPVGTADIPGVPDLTIDWLRRNVSDRPTERPGSFNAPGFWRGKVDPDRLCGLFGWAARVDSSALNDRTTVILGDRETPGGVHFEEGNLVESFAVPGDGTVPDALTTIPGVTRVFRAPGVEHMSLPTDLAVIAAVRRVLAGQSPRTERRRHGGRWALKSGLSGVPLLAPPDETFLTGAPSPSALASCPRLKLDEDEEAVELPPGFGVEELDAECAGELGVDPAAAEEATEASRLGACDESVPAVRRLRVFSFDPLFATELDALGVESFVLALPWSFADGDSLRPGPVGEYVEVVDFDPASACFYAPVDLNHPHRLAQDGVPLSEGDPKFHQQMVYAVAMATIREFEKALGRVVLWNPRLPSEWGTGGRSDDGDGAGDARRAAPHGPPHRHAHTPTRSGDEPWERILTRESPPGELDQAYVPRLRIYPHALRAANAFYDPRRRALLFGYFNAQGDDVGRNLPGGTVFSCLSFDIIAHETTHALLDGVHRYLTDPSNPDVFAFHEAFADAVALFQHFANPEVLRHQLTRTRGDLHGEGMLGVLAAQFGEALGKHGALRSYLGERDPNDPRKWRRVEPDPARIRTAREPHERGAILVAALFRGFANIYENRVADLKRIATNGTGKLPDGDLHPELVERLAQEASKAAHHVLTMCIRALDYLPPVDPTFGDYLRALITADYDLIRDDDRRYRVSMVSAFRDWGIYPEGVRSLSVDSLLWLPPEPHSVRHPREFFGRAREVGWGPHDDRYASFVQMARCRAAFHEWLKAHVAHGRDRGLGLSLTADAVGGIERGRDGWPKFEVHSVRPCRRVGPDGDVLVDAVAVVVQQRLGFFDEGLQAKVDARKLSYRRAAAQADFRFRGGCTLVVDVQTGEIRFCVQKSVAGNGGERRLKAERAFRQGQLGDRVGGIYLGGDDQASPFAFLHGC